MNFFDRFSWQYSVNLCAIFCKSFLSELVSEILFVEGRSYCSHSQSLHQCHRSLFANELFSGICISGVVRAFIFFTGNVSLSRKILPFCAGAVIRQVVRFLSSFFPFICSNPIQQALHPIAVRWKLNLYCTCCFSFKNSKTSESFCIFSL